VDRHFRGHRPFFHLSHFTDFKETHNSPLTSCIHNKNQHLSSVLYRLSNQTSPFSLKCYVKCNSHLPQNIVASEMKRNIRRVCFLKTTTNILVHAAEHTRFLTSNLLFRDVCLN
jgi:hypothetical protein